MGRLTTHVLDLATGRPAAGLALRLRRREPDGGWTTVAEAVTNDDGRLDQPIVSGASFSPGVYELEFMAGPYLAAQHPGGPAPAPATPGAARRVAAAPGAGGDPPFLDTVPIRFGVADAEAHYHVPLLLSPFGYSTYRGS
jgi:5-hydroxyisourate hydrolase